MTTVEHLKDFIEGENCNAKKLIIAIPEDLKDGERKIIHCPVCSNKTYVMRTGKEIRVSCGGCNIDLRFINGLQGRLKNA